MNGTRTLAIGLLATMAGAVVGLRSLVTWGCMGSPVPPCSRTAYVSKFVTQTFANPGPGQPVTIPITLVPVVVWNDQASNLTGQKFCAQPVSASLTLSLTCRGAVSGNVVGAGPFNVPVNVPTVPGRQPLDTPDQRTYDIVVPAGTIPPGEPYRCTVTASYDVDLQPNTGSRSGAGTIRGTGDTTVCVVDGAPGDPSQPRLNLELINRPAAGYDIQRRGDQTTNWYLVSNNDPNEFAVLDIGALSTQAARVPQLVGGGVLTVTHAISDPRPGTDEFPFAFGNALDVGGLIPESDPTDPGQDPILQPMVLGPGEIRIIPVVHQSYGMCADGSCTENTVEAAGTFLPSGDPALACAGSTTFVDEFLDGGGNTPTTVPLCSLFDNVSVGFNEDVLASPMVFNGDHLLSTHPSGNVFPGQMPNGSLLPATRVAGSSAASSQQIEGYPIGNSEDLLRTNEHIDTIEWSFEIVRNGRLEDPTAPRVVNRVKVTNLPDDLGFSIPAVVREGRDSDDLTVIHNFNKGQFIVSAGNSTIFNGSTEQFFSSPRGLEFLGTGRGVFKQQAPSGPILDVTPSGLAVNVLTNTVSFVPPTLEVVDARAPDTTGSGSASLSGSTSAVSFPASTSLGSPFSVTINPSLVPQAPAPALVTSVTVQNLSSVNDVVSVPIAVRQPFTSTLPVGPVDVDSMSFKVDFAKPEKARDQLKIKFVVPIPEGKQVAGEAFTVEIGGFTKTFTLDGQGKPTVKDPKAGFRLKVKSKGGQVFQQAATASLTVKKEDLSGFLHDEGIRNEDLSPGSTAVIKIRYTFCGEVHESFATLSVKAKAGKKASGKL